MYYGNPSASSISNGNNTFLFFDDFSGSSIDTSKWIHDTSATAVSGGIMTLTAVSGDKYIQVNNTNYPYPTYNVAIRGLIQIQSSAFSAWGYLGTAWSLESGKDVIDGQSGNRLHTSLGANVAGGFTAGSYQIHEIRRVSGTLSFYQNDSQISGSPLTSLLPTESESIWIYTGGTSSYYIKVDWILMRNYTSNEPTWGTWNSEETPASAWSNVTKVTNSSGNIKWQVYANDTTNNWNKTDIYSYAPRLTWSLNQTNGSTAGSAIKHSVNWTALVPLNNTGGYIFSFDNGTGTFVNDSFIYFGEIPHNSSDWRTGLVGMWHMNEGSGSTTIDWSGNGNTGTLTNFILNDDPTSAMLSQSGLISFTAANCVDDNTGTNAWHTDSSTAGAYLKIDLGSGNSKEYVKARIYASTPGYAGSYNILYSDDDSTYLTAATGFVPSASGWNEKTWSSVGAHRYWRFNLTNTPGSGSWLNEFEMYKQVGWNSTACKFGSCLGFDGSDDYVILSTAISGIQSANYTVSAWIKKTVAGTTTNEIFNQDYDGNHQIRLELSATTCNATFNTYESGYGTVTGTTNVCDGNWHHVIAVKNGTTGYVYVDGIQQSSDTVKNVVSTDRATIGALRYTAQTLYYFNGTIDEVAIWNRSLSATEVSQLYNMSKDLPRNAWSNITKVTNSNGNIRWQIYANDTSNNWNKTDVYSYAPRLTWSLNQTNGTTAGSAIKHSLNWTALVSLNNTGGYIFSFDNGTGTFVNDSFIYFGEIPHNSSDWRTGLFSMWHMNEGSGTTIADSSGNDHTGTFGSPNPAWITTGKFSNGIRFNSNSIALGTLDISTQGQPFSVFAWINTSQSGGGASTNGIFFSKRTGSNTFAMSMYGGNVSVDNWAGGDDKLKGTIRVNDSIWHYVGFTWDGTTAWLYVDGILDKSVAVSFSTQSIANGNSLGAFDSGTTRPYIGDLDEVSTWNRNLSATEISTLYNMSKDLPRSAWSNVTKVVNSTVGSTIRWQVYANDTSNNWNKTNVYSYATT